MLVKLGAADRVFLFLLWKPTFCPSQQGNVHRLPSMGVEDIILSSKYAMHCTAVMFHGTGHLAGGEDEWLDDDVDIEEDDEFRKRRLQHDKKKRQAEKVRNPARGGSHELRRLGGFFYASCTTNHEQILSEGEPSPRSICLWYMVAHLSTSRSLLSLRCGVF